MNWLLLMHQIPPRPVSLRLRVWRRLQRVGAVSIKNSVWALPAGDGEQEDFEWIRREIEKGGGEAVIVKAELVEGISDASVKKQFVDARDAEYAELTRAARALGKKPGGELTRLRRRLEEIRERDPFGAPGFALAQKVLERFDAPPPKRPRPAKGYQGRLWVTRQRVFVDRMACAWLIERFIDRKPAFRFVEGDRYRPAKGELRFDMFEGEFTHEGDRCSFEVMTRKFCPGDRALAQIAEIIHDLDIKDDKFGRDEAAGVLRMLTGIREGQPDDPARIARAGAVFDDLYSAFTRTGARS